MSSDADAFSDHELSSWNDFVCAAWTDAMHCNEQTIAGWPA